MTNSRPKSITVGDFIKLSGSRVQTEDKKISLDHDKVNIFLTRRNYTEILTAPSGGYPTVSRRSNGTEVLVSGHHRQAMAAEAVKQGLISENLKMYIALMEGMTLAEESRGVLIANQTARKNDRLHLINLKTDVAMKLWKPIDTALKRLPNYKDIPAGQRHKLITQLGATINSGPHVIEAIEAEKYVEDLTPGIVYHKRSASEIKSLGDGEAFIDLRNHIPYLTACLDKVCGTLAILKSNDGFMTSLYNVGAPGISVHLVYLLTEAAFSGKLSLDPKAHGKITANTVLKAFSGTQRKHVMRAFRNITAEPAVTYANLMSMFGAE